MTTMTNAVTGLARKFAGVRSGEALGFAAKVIGVGLFAGLTLTYCQFLIDACFRGLH
jgi:hypothetical protein